MPVPVGYKTAEEIAVEVGRSIYLVNQVAKELGLQKVVFPEDNRRRFSPENVQRLKEAIANRG
jgi:hypothetical protein